MYSNKVKNSTDAGMFCTMHCIKVQFCIPEFSRSNIVLKHFHVDNNKTESCIGYDKIIFRDLMVDIVLLDNFKNKVIQCDLTTLPMKEHRGLLGKTDLTSCKMNKVVV